MNLPNFMNFEPFNRLRRAMKTNRLGNFSVGGAAAPAADKKPAKKPGRKPAAAAQSAKKPSAKKASAAKKPPGKSAAKAKTAAGGRKTAATKKPAATGGGKTGKAGAAKKKAARPAK